MAIEAKVITSKQAWQLLWRAHFMCLASLPVSIYEVNVIRLKSAVPSLRPVSSDWGRSDLEQVSVVPLSTLLCPCR